MKHKVDLTQGNIAIQLTKVALPIMFTSFIQMAYNLTDMFWIGRLGSGAVAAVGSAGFFIWLGMSIMLCTRIGMEVTVAQSAGKNDSVGMQRFILNGITISILIILVYSILIFMFAPRLIHFFNLGTDVNGFNPTAKGIQYLRILSCCMLFAFMSPCFSAIYNGLGKSKLPFYFNSAGLGLNIILDPLLIYGVWIFPRLEVAGAAIATIIAQVTVIFLFILSFRKNFIFMHKLKNFLTLQKDYCFRIIKIGFPPAVQGVLFASIAIVIARIVSEWGAFTIAAQRLGSQIEAISWLTATGFSTAISAFVGQNIGAGKIDRVWQGYKTGIYIMTGVGLFATALLFLLPQQLYSIFVKDPQTIQAGVGYLTIIAYSQLFMCLEMSTAGAFNGLGKSMPPSIVGVSFNLLRIPGAIFLSSLIGISGIWWSISGTSVLKGIVLVVWFIVYFKKGMNKKNLY
ncbi:MAG: MATE family efflux transporter [Candidatus Cloacimonetes bacterium]|nr:MATE family efflux transporter [Candidatus Cloacimonadota bacterium]